MYMYHRRWIPWCHINERCTLVASDSVCKLGGIAWTLTCYITLSLWQACNRGSRICPIVTSYPILMKKKLKIYHALGCSLCQCITKSSYISMRVFQYPSALCLLLGAEKVYPSPGKELRHPGSGLDNNNNNNEILIKREPQVYTRARRSVQKKRERRRRRRPGQHNSNNKLIHWQHTGRHNLHSPSPPPHTHIYHIASQMTYL